MIRAITADDEALFLELMDEFYHTEAVLHPISKELYYDTFHEMLTSDKYLEGYILEHEGKPAGYATISKGFSSEVGGRVIWLEELYIRSDYRGAGLGSEFLNFLDDRCGEKIRRLRLEVEADNTRAVSLYRRKGFEKLPYVQMVKDYV